MDKYIVFDRQLTKADLVVLQSLTEDLREHTRKEGGDGAAKANGKTLDASTSDADAKASNDGTSPNQHGAYALSIPSITHM